MNRSFRWGIALVCFAIGVVSAAPAKAEDVSKFLPNETDLVIQLNVRQVLDSELVKKHALDLIKTTFSGNKEAQEAIKALGLDPLTDFNHVSAGLGLEDVNNPKAVFVVEGKFDPKKIADVFEALAKKEPKKFAVESVGGKTIYKINAQDMPVPAYAAVIDSKILVLATAKEYIGNAFEAAQGTRKPAIKKELVDLLRKVDPKSSLSLVAFTKGRLEGIPLPDDVKKVIDQIHNISIDLKVETDVNLEISIGVAAADAAKQLKLYVGAGLDIVKLQGKGLLAQQPALQPLYDLLVSMKTMQNEKIVVISGKLTGEAIEKALKKDK